MKTEIEYARRIDLEDLYKLALSIPELQTHPPDPFMSEHEFDGCIANVLGTFLLARVNDRIVGFVYAAGHDPERSPRSRAACLVYLAVHPGHRHRGIGRKLLEACEADLKNRHCYTTVYGWACDEGSSNINDLLGEEGYSTGRRYRWVEKEL